MKERIFNAPLATLALVFCLILAISFTVPNGWMLLRAIFKIALNVAIALVLLVVFISMLRIRKSRRPGKNKRKLLFKNQRPV